MISISYLICTHNEGSKYLKPLFTRVLQGAIIDEDEVVVLDDNSDDPDTLEVFDLIKKNRPDIKFIYHDLNGDFAAHKNAGKAACTKPYLLQIDGDELPHENLIATLKETLLFNPTVDLYRVPRMNFVQGIKPEHIQQWGWNINEKGFINFPDYQDRIFKNIPEISWINKVHEKIVGHSTHAELPAVDDYCLLHVKNIIRQELQNKFYSTL